MLSDPVFIVSYIRSFGAETALILSASTYQEYASRIKEFLLTIPEPRVRDRAILRLEKIRNFASIYALGPMVHGDSIRYAILELADFVEANCEADSYESSVTIPATAGAIARD